MDTDVFYTDGLRFSCTQCSRCCRHDSGYVFLSENDVNALTNRLGVSREKFIEEYCVWAPAGLGHHLSLSEQENHDCVFWRDGGCSVYGDRPTQCWTYPFWEHIVTDSVGWERERRECPGIDIGRRHSFFEIRNDLAARVRNRPIRKGGR